MWVPAGALLTVIALTLLAGWLRAGAASASASRLGVVIVAVLAASALSACDQAGPTATTMAAGDPSRGREALRTYGCVTCHTIPGVQGAAALVGPNLDQVASRMYIAGVMPNTPDNMIRWVQHPRDVDPLTAMPNLGVTDQDARDIVGYLYTLK